MKNCDINESLGGPFLRDKVWFWFSARANKMENQAPVFVNRTRTTRASGSTCPTRAPACNKGHQVQQQHARDLAGNAAQQDRRHLQGRQVVQLPEQHQRHVAPEAGRDRRFPRLRQEHLEWTSPVTSRLLLDAVGLHLYERWGNMHLPPERRFARGRAQEADPAADDLGDRAEQQPDLPLAGDLQQHAGAELRRIARRVAT